MLGVTCKTSTMTATLTILLSMTIFFMAFCVLFILIWILSRKSLIYFLLNPLLLSNKYVLIFDLLFVGSTIISVLVRISLIDVNSSVTYALRVHYVLMGLSWLLSLLYIVKVVIKFIPSKKKDGFIENRRDFLKKNVALAGVGTVVSATTVGAIQAFDPKLEKVDIKIEDKYKALKGLSIVQLSDIHIGPTLKKSFFDSLVKRTNDLNPDVIVITGDMIDGTVKSLRDELTGLSKLKAKLGVYYITGNHEYYWNGLEWINFVKSHGIKVFENDSVTLSYNGQEFDLGGVYDLKATRFEPTHTCSPEKVFKDSSNYKILLAHQPNTCHLAEGLNINLQLSGHTHGGQGFPWNLVVGIVQPYLKGLYNHKGMQLYVNRGTGFWGPPYRLGIPGEITHLTLV